MFGSSGAKFGIFCSIFVYDILVLFIQAHRQKSAPIDVNCDSIQSQISYSLSDVSAL